MKSMFTSLFVAMVISNAIAMEIKRHGCGEPVRDGLRCYVCDWTADLDGCKKTKDTETCDDNMVCVTRYRLIDDGVIQVKKGCKQRVWAGNQPSCEDNKNAKGQIVVGETCVNYCEENLCNTNDDDCVVRGPTERSCYQREWSTQRYCATSALCSMSEAACATQVKFTEDGQKLYQYKCHQKHYCQQNFISGNHGNCGSNPDEATPAPCNQICNYCTSDVEADNSNP
ncbi:uncharacterized protein [Ptychodera flava]|uniref:uncharacterized protein n=1 Tax=Ptychodera flava TaxID=63121 RepID=UPI00396A5A2D